MAQTSLGFATLMIVVLFSGPGAAQQTFYYPTQGQTPEQQSLDRGQCHSWAVQQSGFDPTNPGVAAPPPSSAQPPQGGLLRGAARGAALGAVGGAIGGDAGKGAAVGAGVGALFGGFRRMDQVRNQQYQQQQYYQQQQAMVAQGQAAYSRALGACMQGRGYAVQ